MGTMELTKKQLILVSDLYEEGEEVDGFKLVESTEWVDDGKVSYHDVIFEYKGKTWLMNESRQGSYHTDYYYDTVEGYHDGFVFEVEKKEVTTYKWVGVKDHGIKLRPGK